ncbi:MAG: CoA pyrophosphatase [Phreatobacter sp.]|nr:CoA pyrophosphatase [Phreatobacter sp.]
MPVSPEQFTAAVTERLSLDVPREPQELFRGLGYPRPDAGDHTINEGQPARPAAVLIPVVSRPEPTILLTQRSGDLPDHSGQIAFPGGKIDPGDATPLDAALREAEEEIGLDRRHVRPLAYMPPFLSRTGYLITPVIGLVAPPFELTINPREVVDAFEVPLAFLMDPKNHQRQSREWQGQVRHFYAMPYGDRYIWGVTAGILRNLWERLADQETSGAA